MNYVLKQVTICVLVHEALRKHFFVGAAALLSSLACRQ